MLDFRMSANVFTLTKADSGLFLVGFHRRHSGGGSGRRPEPTVGS
jgi:hypothetical protein